MPRHKRKAIPDRVKRQACLIMQGYEPGTDFPGLSVEMLLHNLGFRPRLNEIQWDHDPPLELRPDNAEGTDYEPPQLDPRHIFPMLKADHKAKTTGRRGESKLSISGNGDKSRIDKVKRLRGELKPKPKRTWPKRKLESRPFNKPR